MVKRQGTAFVEYLPRLIASYVPAALVMTLVESLLQLQHGRLNLGLVLILLWGDAIGLVIGLFLVLPFAVLAAWGHTRGRAWPRRVVLGVGITLGAAAAAATVWMLLLATTEVDAPLRWIEAAWLTGTVALVSPVWAAALFLPCERIARPAAVADG